MPQTLLKKSRLLPQTYTIQHKEQMKERLFKTLKTKYTNGKRDFVVGLTIDAHNESLETWIKQELVPALDSAGISTFVVGENTFKNKFKHVYFLSAAHCKDAWQACDLWIWPSEQEMTSVMHYGTLCVAQDSHRIENYHPQHETGNGFVCPIQNPWMLFAAIVGAQVNYTFPYDWKHICQNAMDWSYHDKH